MFLLHTLQVYKWHLLKSVFQKHLHPVPPLESPIVLSQEKLRSAAATAYGCAGFKDCRYLLKNRNRRTRLYPPRKPARKLRIFKLLSSFNFVNFACRFVVDCMRTLCTGSGRFTNLVRFKSNGRHASFRLKLLMKSFDSKLLNMIPIWEV